MSGRLIITNGDEAVARLKGAGIEAAFIPWRDALHEGPVPGGLLLEARSLVRVQFLARELGLRLTEVLRQFEQRNAAMRNHGQYARVELWFEQDLYDQLQLLEVLDFFASEQRQGELLLAQADAEIATQSADTLRSLAEAAQPVSAERFDAARRAWSAFTAQRPGKLAALAAADVPGLPHLAPALQRLVQEFPAVGSGLNLTEERILGLLAEAERSVRDLFKAAQELEVARFMGDVWFFRCLDGLAFARQPLIEGLPFPYTRCANQAPTAGHIAYAGASLRLTDTGRACLMSRFDHARENAIERWIGGAHLTAKNMWRRTANGVAQIA